MWRVRWTAPNSNGVPLEFWVGFDTTVVPTGDFDYGYTDPTTTPHFEQGQCFLGVIEGGCPVTGSYDGATGKIVLKFDTSKALAYSLATNSTLAPFTGSFGVGTVLADIGATSELLVGVAGTGAIENVDDSPRGSYVGQGNAVCNGVTHAATQGGLTVDPPTLDFGAQPSGSTALRTVTLSNTGSSTITLDNFYLAAAEFTRTVQCGKTLAPGASCTLTVGYKPRTSSGAPSSGEIVIRSSDPSSPTQIALSGSGTAATTGKPALTLSTHALDFGTQAAGSVSTQPVTLSNNGTVAVSLGGFYVVGPDFGRSTDCPKILWPGASCTVSVSFKPRAATGQPSSGTLAIRSNAPSSPDQVSLTGQAQ
jgi:hypothetical protein